ncbi:DUF4926 domain-containing protein [Microlunatus soli]|uniref:DUF4926 domain-containing protein n=1 Tax=Microlunatus soli TaxID=630515 RepID=UPI0012FC9BA6
MREPGRRTVSGAELFQPFDVVVLPEGIPEAGVPAGSRAVVVEVHRATLGLAYEVEVSRADGRTTLLSPRRALVHRRQPSAVVGGRRPSRRGRFGRAGLRQHRHLRVG